MYLLTFENAKSRKEATIKIDGITGEVALNEIRNLAVRTIATFQETVESQPAQPIVCEDVQIEPVLSVIPPVTKDDVEVSQKEGQTVESQPVAEETMILGFPARIFGEVVTIDDKETTVVGDVEIPSGTNIDKNLAVTGALKIGDNCRGDVKRIVLK